MCKCRTRPGRTGSLRGVFLVPGSPASHAVLEIWSDRSRTPLPESGPGDIFLFDLSENPQLEMHDPFDMVRCYISQSSMDSLSYEHGQRRVSGLRLAQFGTYDPVMHGIATSMAGVMQRPGEAPTMFVEHMSLAFHAHVSHAYGGASEELRRNGGLTHWQLRRVCDAMQERLNFNHSIGGLAIECGLSSRQFARAFKETTGFTPHQWLMSRRIERSRELLAQTNLNLVDIALECGFVDQSHFSRVFAQFQKQTPAKWRRLAH